MAGGLRYIDVCSGISAPTMAWKPLGWEAVCFAEIDAAPRAVLAHHYPQVPLRGDFTEIAGTEYGPVDLLVGGTPCQSFSVAGLRGGLADDRGNLALEYLRLADRARPRWLVWENVPGVLSSNGGRDFGAILGGMAELGYGFAYRVLDAQHFGVPQRRRRVFVVGHIGDWRRAAAVLFERHSLQGNPAPRRETGENAPTIPSRSSAGGGLGTDFDCDGGLIAPTVNAAFGSKLGLDNQHIDSGAGLFVLIERGRNGQPNLEYRADGTANAILTPNGGRGGLGVGAVCFGWQASSTQSMNPGPVAPTLDKSKSLAVMENQRAELRLSEQTDALATGGGKPGQGYPATLQGSQVRRLTPRECERLQGFPDDFTLVPYRSRMMADGPRHKMLGNSMAVPVVRWIGERIERVEALSLQREAA